MKKRTKFRYKDSNEYNLKDLLSGEDNIISIRQASNNKCLRLGKLLNDLLNKKGIDSAVFKISNIMKNRRVYLYNYENNTINACNFHVIVVSGNCVIDIAHSNNMVELGDYIKTLKKLNRHNGNIEITRIA